MRVRRAAAAVVAVLALSLGATAAEAAPPPFVPHPPPIASTFKIHPSSGPVGTKVTMTGLCGSATAALLYVVQLSEVGFDPIWVPPEWAPLKPTPLGVFSVSFKFPATGNFGIGGPWNGKPLTPGTYYVSASCNGAPAMPAQPFTVVARAR